MKRGPLKILYFALGWISLALGAIGAFLPVLPTTPFVILAAYFFSKSSEKWHKWLRERPVFGPMIIDWETRGVIPKKAKIYASLMMALAFGSTLIFAKVSFAIKCAVAAIGVGAAIFIWTRPSN